MPATQGGPLDAVGAAKGAAMAAGVALGFRLKDAALAASGCVLGARICVEAAWPTALRAGRWLDEAVLPRIALASDRRRLFDESEKAARAAAGRVAGVTPEAARRRAAAATDFFKHMKGAPEKEIATAALAAAGFFAQRASPAIPPPVRAALAPVLALEAYLEATALGTAAKGAASAASAAAGK